MAAISHFQFIAHRWQSLFWRLYDLFLLTFGWLRGVYVIFTFRA